jgi:hypothetical protein
VLKMTAAERRTRLGRRHRLAAETKASDPVQAAASVVALHGTDAASVFVSAWARMRDGDVAAVERALYEDRSLLRVLAMRRTMFVAPVDTAACMLAGCSPDVAARERRRLVSMVEDAGLGGGDAEAWVAAAEAAALDALARHGEATAPELAGDDPHLSAVLVVGAGKKYEARQKMVGRVLTVLGAQGRAIRTSPRGSWTSTQFRWAALDRWQPDAVTRPAADDARAELTRRWLASFGPATLDDLRWWTGWTLGATRAAVAANGTVEVELDGHAGLALADDLEPEPLAAPWAALLPALDATTMGWKERDWYLGDRGPLLFDRNGNAAPTVWWDGRIVGGWAQAPDGEIRFRLLEDVGAEAVAAVETSAAELEARVGTAKLSPRARARSPVELELLGS